MQYNPDAFENFLKSKLDEVEADATQQELLWNQLSTSDRKKKWWENYKVLIVLSLLIFAGIYSFIQWENFSNDKAVKLNVPVKEDAFKLPAPDSVQAGTLNDNKELNHEPAIKRFSLKKSTTVKGLVKSNSQNEYTRIITAPTKETEASTTKEPVNVNPSIVQIRPEAQLVIKDSLAIIIEQKAEDKKKKKAVYIIW